VRAGCTADCVASNIGAHLALTRLASLATLSHRERVKRPPTEKRKEAFRPPSLTAQCRNIRLDTGRKVEVLFDLPCDQHDHERLLALGNSRRAEDDCLTDLQIEGSLEELRERGLVPFDRLQFRELQLADPD